MTRVGRVRLVVHRRPASGERARATLRSERRQRLSGKANKCQTNGSKRARCLCWPSCVILVAAHNEPDVRSDPGSSVRFPSQMFSRIKLVFDLIRQLDAEYRAVKERIDNSPDLPVSRPTIPFWTVPPVQLPIDNDAPLPEHVDVLVIGSGITGVSCTRTLLRHGPPGLRVLVLEARDVCSGATGR